MPSNGYSTPAAIGNAQMLYIQAHRKLNLTRLNTARESSVNVSMLRRSDETRMNFALPRATSEPEPMAMPTSETESAGASLIPSPTMAIMARCGAGLLLRKWITLCQWERGRLGAVFWRWRILSACRVTITISHSLRSIIRK